MNYKLIIASVIVPLPAMLVLYMNGAPTWTVFALGFLMQNQILWGGTK